MRDFFISGISVFCLGIASVMVLTSVEPAIAGPTVYCSIPVGGCAPELGNVHCTGQCTDLTPNDNVSCDCDPSPVGAPDPCMCWAR
jgi:hypothetical protein